MYENICQKIKKQHPSVATLIGNQEIGPSEKYSDIASFKAQNQELMKQFVHQIRNADIVIADLTNNYPNVHVELGIALIENKNILRVTGRPVTELGFDIRGLEVNQYKEKSTEGSAIDIRQESTEGSAIDIRHIHTVRGIQLIELMGKVTSEALIVLVNG